MIMCFGEAVFPIITIIEIMMLGIKIILNLHKQITASAMNDDSRIIAFVIN